MSDAKKCGACNGHGIVMLGNGRDELCVNCGGTGVSGYGTGIETTASTDGGPAFPRTGDGSCIEPQSGMTIRDYLAAAALTGLLASDRTYKDTRELADATYYMADAMLRAREAKR